MLDNSKFLSGLLGFGVHCSSKYIVLNSAWPYFHKEGACRSWWLYYSVQMRTLKSST